MHSKTRPPAAASDEFGKHPRKILTGGKPRTRPTRWSRWGGYTSAKGSYYEEILAQLIAAGKFRHR